MRPWPPASFSASPSRRPPARRGPAHRPIPLRRAEPRSAAFRFLAALAALEFAGAASARAQGPVGGEFQVNVYTTAYQTSPSVAVGGPGSFVVVWRSDGSTGTDASGASIQGRRFAADGTALGGDFQVNTYTTGMQERPAVAMDALGNFVVAWSSDGSNGYVPDAQDIRARRFGANGVPAGDEFQVNTYTTGRQSAPAVAMGDAGNFVVAWDSAGSSGSDTSSESVQARRYAANGAPLADQFQVNTYTTSFQVAAAVDVDDRGRFVVAWMSNGSSGTDSSAFSVHARRYDADGVALGGQFQVNSLTTGSQSEPAVAVHGHGEIVVAWRSDVSSGTDSFFASIQARRFAADGAPLTGDFQVNSFTERNQIEPAVAVDQGRLVVTWSSDDWNGTDTDARAVKAQRYSWFLFADGFESRNTLGWSAESPPLATPTVYRWSDLDLRDPHVYANLPIVGCSDVTDTTPAGAQFSVNAQIQASIAGDGDGDGELDLSTLLAFRPFDPLAIAGRLDVGDGACAAPNPPASCGWRMPPIPRTVDYDARTAGTCLAPLAGTTHGYSPSIALAGAPCHVSEPEATAAFPVLGAMVPLREVQSAAHFGSGTPPSSLAPGLFMGFLRESDADATIVSLPGLGIPPTPLSAFLPGGTGGCAPHDDRDLGPQNEIGWWVYFNFTAAPVPFTGR
jgi:hypothetical protein